MTMGQKNDIHLKMDESYYTIELVVAAADDDDSWTEHHLVDEREQLGSSELLEETAEAMV